MEKTKEQIETDLLALQASGGDADALDSLLRRWQEPLWRYLRGLCGEDQQAWDLLQETCLSIAKSIHRLKRSEAFTSMAYQIAYRRYVDYVRADRRNKALTAAAQKQAPESTERRSLDSEQSLIREAVAQLNEMDRSIVTLTYLEGYSYEDIAQLKGIPLGTVKSRIHYAKNIIRQTIEREQT